MSDTPQNPSLRIAVPTAIEQSAQIEWRDNLQSALAGLMNSLNDPELNYVIDRMMDGVGEILMVRRHQNGSGNDEIHASGQSINRPALPCLGLRGIGQLRTQFQSHIEEGSMPKNEIREAAQWLLDKGIVALPLYPAKNGQTGKVPNCGGDWGNYQTKLDDFTPESNIGALLGPRSDHLTDVDLDWPEAAALAMKLLPPSWSFGRHAQTNGQKTRLTHMIYRCEGISRKIYAPPDEFANDRKGCIIELRGAKHQTVFPPSVLLPGDRLEWIDDPQLTDLRELSLSSLIEYAGLIAGGALLLYRWPTATGKRHDVALALAGACHHAGWPHGKIQTVLGALFELADDSESGDRLRAVADTLKNATAGQDVSGFPTLADHLPGELLDRLRGWWQIGGSDVWSDLEIGGRPAAEAVREQAEAEQIKPEAVEPPLLDVPAFPMDALPDNYRAFVADVADRMQCPVDYVAVSLMLCTAGLVGAQLAVRPQQYNNWTEVPNLWGGIVGPPGSRKSPALNETRKFLKTLEADYLTDYIKAKRLYDIEKLTYDLDLAKLRKDKNRQPSDVSDLIKRKPVPPTLKQLMVSDNTIEALQVDLRDNPNGLLLSLDELSRWLERLDDARRASERKAYLECWAGNHSDKISRIGRGHITIPRLCLSVLGSIQAGPLRQYLMQTLDGGTKADGLLQRFQLLVWPDVELSEILSDQLPDAAAQDTITRIFGSLATIADRGIGDIDPDAVIDGQPVQRFIRFEPAAQPVFDAWYGKLMRIAKAEPEGSAIQAHLTKYPGMVPSLALLIHLVDSDGHQISTAALDKAIKWYDYLLGHIRRVYAYAPDPGVIVAELIQARWSDVPARFTARDLYRKHWAGIGSKARLDAGLNELVDASWLDRELAQKGKRRFTQYVKVQP